MLFDIIRQYAYKRWMGSYEMTLTAPKLWMFANFIQLRNWLMRTSVNCVTANTICMNVTHALHVVTYLLALCKQALSNKYNRQNQYKENEQNQSQCIQLNRKMSLSGYKTVLVTRWKLLPYIKIFYNTKLRIVTK